MTDTEQQIARAAVKAYFNSITHLGGAISARRALWSVRSIIGQAASDEELVAMITEQATAIFVGVVLDLTAG